jgi:superfamily II DNA or RNA helicase
MIKFEQFNETHMKVWCDDFGIEMEMQEFFTFMAPGYKFMPAFKNKIWDGKIRLLDVRRKTLYKGLLNFAIKFCKDRDYEFELDPRLNPKSGITETQTAEFINSLQLSSKGNPLQIRDYQYDAVFRMLETKRNLAISPTSSGKSMMIYSKMRYHLDKFDHRVLIVVPTTMLVEQLFSDFKDYSGINGWDVEDNIQTLYSGKEKVFSKNVMISTWQSLHAMIKNQPKNFKEIVDNVDCMILDEAHTYRASAVLETMEKFVNTEWRTGTTGTIDNSKINELSLIGLMGPIYRVITTKELMDRGQVTELKIKALLLQYPEEVRKTMKGMKYQDEVKFLIGNDTRNRFIANLTKACKGNTLILFNFVESHGAVIYDLVQSKLEGTGRKVHFVHGGTDVDSREQIRLMVETEQDSVIIATASLFSTGINMPSIENIIFAIPSKSTIRIRQSIGRGLRLKHGKTICNLYDIVDDLSTKSWENTTLKHFHARVSIYDSEQFNWSLTKIPLDTIRV